MIRKYVKKPVEIEAVQYTGDYFKEVCDFVGKILNRTDSEQSSIIIETLEGDHLALVNDYIIKGIKGEFYPCKPDIFEETYEESIDNECLIDHSKNTRVLDNNIEIETDIYDIYTACTIRMEVGTTGCKGGDCGNGGRTYFNISDQGGTAMTINPFRRKYDNSWEYVLEFDKTNSDYCDCSQLAPRLDQGFEIILGGDSELYSMIKALKLITNTLEKKYNNSKE